MSSMHLAIIFRRIIESSAQTNCSKNYKKLIAISLDDDNMWLEKKKTIYLVVTIINKSRNFLIFI